jgi:class 3 adenylate cyclase
MDNPSGRTLVCSVLFLDIVEYSRKPVSDQLQLKQAFNKALARALEHVAPRDRIILDTGDGAAVTFMGDPEDALFAAMAVRDASGGVPVRLGVNLGPVRLVKDLNDQVNIIGDGINVAQRVMSFASPGQLLVSRSFYEVVSCLSRDYAKLFRHEGARTDKHVREHDVYAVVGTSSRVGDTTAHQRAAEPRRGVLGLRPSALVAAPVVFLLIVGGAFAARVALEPVPAAAVAPPPEIKKPVAPKAQLSPVKPALAEAPSRPQPAAPARVAAAEPVKAAKKPVAPRPGKVVVAVSPSGEVFVDGKSHGMASPHREISHAPGTYEVEVRSNLRRQMQRVQVKSGEASKVEYSFRR